MNNLFEKIADYIVKQVQENSKLSGFQYIVDHTDIQTIFNQEIDEYINNKIIEALCKKEEVADAQVDTDGFDVVLYTKYAPNYVEEE